MVAIHKIYSRDIIKMVTLSIFNKVIQIAFKHSNDKEINQSNWHVLAPR
jgi:hypothetical protein